MLKLKKCAYIFNDTNNKYCFGLKDYERKQAIQTELKKYYSDTALREKPINYTTKSIKVYDGTTIDRYYINLNGFEIALNDGEIAYILDDPNNIINHRLNKDFSGLNCSKYHKHNDTWINSKKYKSLYFECFTDINSLGYYRFNFKNHSYCFIVDCRNGDLYSFYGIKHKKILINDIYKNLDVVSDPAKTEIKTIIDYLIGGCNNE